MMDIRWIGAVLIIGSGAAAGFGLAAQYRWEMNLLKELASLIEYMECELVYRKTALPELFVLSSQKASGVLKEVFSSLARSLSEGHDSSGQACMDRVVNHHERIPHSVKQILRMFGNTMGIFDLEGQLNGLRSVKQECLRQLGFRRENQEERIRSYRTLGICAGAGLAILFI